MTIGLITRWSATPSRNQMRFNGASRRGYESATTANAIATIIDHHRSSPPNAQGHKAKTANTTANTIPNERSEAPVTLRRETMGSLIDIWFRPISHRHTFVMPSHVPGTAYLPSNEVCYQTMAVPWSLSSF